MAEQSKVGQNAQKSFAQMHKDGNVKNGVGIEVDELNSIEVKESMQKTAARNSKTMLEKEQKTTICLWIGRGRVSFSTFQSMRACSGRRPSATIEFRSTVVRLLLENSRSFSRISNSKKDDSAAAAFLDDLRGIVDEEVAC